MSRFIRAKRMRKPGGLTVVLLAYVCLFMQSSIVSSILGAEPNEKLKHLLLITDSGGFIHDSVGVAEDILKELGPKNGFDVTCFRFTRDPKQVMKYKQRVKGKETVIEKSVLEKYSEEFRARTGKTVEKENCGRVNAETLKKFDAVLFFTTGNPLTKEEVNDLTAWVKNGGAFAGTHCATDTLYGATAYGDLVGAYFLKHPWHQKVKIKVEDPNHPAGSAFSGDPIITDEIYEFRPAPYSRSKLHIIYSIDPSSIDLSRGNRSDKDYAVSWCHEYGKGKAFYTSLGHRREVWKDPRFQAHLIGGLQWAMGMKQGSATPSSPSK